MFNVILKQFNLNDLIKSSVLISNTVNVDILQIT